MRYLLAGNYGTGNLGDEALKDYFRKRFPEVEWTAVSATPKPRSGDVPRFPFGMRSLLFSPWWRTWKALRRSDGIVFGGGSLFTDVESVRACLLWFLHALAATMLRKRIVLAFQGIGPFRTRAGEWCARSVVVWSSFVSVRDELSFQRVRSWGLNKNYIQTFDPVFSMIEANQSKIRTKKLFAVIPRAHSSVSLLRRAHARAQEFAACRIISLEPGNSREKVLCRQLRASIPHAEITFPRTLDELCSALRGVHFVLTERYHGALAALALGIPVEIIPQAPDDKLSALRTLPMEDRDRRSTEAYLRELVRSGEDALREALRGMP